MSVVDEIKGRLDIVDIVSETVKLRHSGKNYTGFCPFTPTQKHPLLLYFPILNLGAALGSATRAGTSSIL